jgi:hypothetical protein
MWTMEYFEQRDGVQPAEVFEDALYRDARKLAGKLARIIVELETKGPQLGGGLIERCHGYAGLWEARTIFNKKLAREFFGFDGSQVILLHGYVKQTGQPAPTKDMSQADGYWHAYQMTHTVSPEEPEEHLGE